MRVNIYGEDLSSDVELWTKDARCGSFVGVRFVLHPVTPRDTAPAVTFWCRQDRDDIRPMLRQALAELDAYYAGRPPP